MKNTLKKNTFLILLFASFCSGAEQPSDSEQDDETPEEYLVRSLTYDDCYHEDEPDDVVRPTLGDPVVPALRAQEPNETKKALLQCITLNREIDPEYFKVKRHPLDFFFLSRGKKEELSGYIEIDIAIPFWYQALQSKSWVPLLQLLTHDPGIFTHLCRKNSFWELFAQAQPPLEVVARVKAFPSILVHHVYALGTLHPRTLPTTKQLFIDFGNKAALRCDAIPQYQEAISKLCAAELAANTYGHAVERPDFNPREHLSEILLHFWERGEYHGFERYFRLVSMYNLRYKELIHLMAEGFHQILKHNQACTSIPFHFITAALKNFRRKDKDTYVTFLQRCEGLVVFEKGGEQIISVLKTLKAEHAPKEE